MRIFNAIGDVTPDARGAVLVIGNFDGVHKGHQALLGQGAAAARAKGLKLAVLTFEPHPRKLFRADEPPSRITPPALKAERLETCGVDTLFSLHFDWDFASLSAGDFIRKILIEGLGAAHVVVGADFRFGQFRKGAPETIEDSGIPVTVIDKIESAGGQVYSSSLIRQSLRRGELEVASAALGWDWEIRGPVVKGDQRGRTLGYPTANVPLGETVHPAYGVYATWVQIEGEDVWRPSATNIGIRPMFEIPTAQVETFIFDFDREIYGKTLRIRPVKRLRSEAKFHSLDELVRQIEEDCREAGKILTP